MRFAEDLLALHLTQGLLCSSFWGFSGFWVGDYITVPKMELHRRVWVNPKPKNAVKLGALLCYEVFAAQNSLLHGPDEKCDHATY